MKDSLKRFVISLLQRLTNLAVWIGSKLIRLLPTRTWLLIRENTQIVRLMDYDRAPIRIAVDSSIEYDYRLVSCKKEPDTVKWIENWFKPGDVFYDIGANVGAYSLIAFTFLEGKTKICAFEPGFQTFPQLCKNILLNHAENSILPWPIALSDQTTIDSFHYQNIVPGGALHALGDAIDQYGKQFSPVLTLPVMSYSLDEFIHQFNLPIPNHIKIDVDGTEYQILNGAKAILNRPELHSLLVEFTHKQSENQKIEELLEECGFILHSFERRNYVYCRKSTSSKNNLKRPSF